MNPKAGSEDSGRYGTTPTTSQIVMVIGVADTAAGRIWSSRFCDLPPLYFWLFSVGTTLPLTGSTTRGLNSKAFASSSRQGR